MLRVVSLGAGVQSSTMALMAAAGELMPMPDCAIFADTQWEPKQVYRHLNWLEDQLPFPVHRVSAGDLRQAVLNRSNTTGGRFAAVPWYMRMPNGDAALGRRQCTKEYKLRPIQRKVVELTGHRRKGGVEMWIGISWDEVTRMRQSQVQYINNRWPLIEKQMRRYDCLKWLDKHGYPEPPKSSCIGCPFHNNDQWRAIKVSSPEEWADAIEIDKSIRNQPGSRGEQYMHSSMRPLAEADLRSDAELGQLDLFTNECQGLCGV